MGVYYPRASDPRPTETFPIVQRTGIRFFRRMTVATGGLFREIGRRTYYVRDMLRAFGDPATYARETLRQMRNIGVGSVPITLIVAGFIGAVIALQTRYQLFSGVDKALVGLAARQMIILELGPLLTGLVLTGRVGARMTAEIGTMRVTEQIDALETLAYDPIAYLVVPRFLAALIMLPVLVILADGFGVLSGYVVGVAFTDITQQQYEAGLHLSFTTFQVTYSLIKAVMFGAAIALICSYEGYVTAAGAEGVGRSTARAVVITSVTILVLDGLTAAALAPRLQA